ncbi:ammonium transporter [Actinocorallia aurantiaca]|uniref:Ammonium transporter n=2 Tax=Actinocorallia aurantiaca TaxID=46204 RepID=A0ABN3U7X1_9ACTN
MSRAKSVLNMMMMSFVSMSIVSMVWVLWGYSVAFGSEGGVPAFFGGLDAWGLVGLEAEGDGYPALAFVAFQATFAIITVALISGAIADRTKFTTWCVFVPIWITLVYLPIAHSVWFAEGWIFKLGALDFAGGTVVHINAGCAALALALVLGKRKGWPKEPMRPHNLPFVLLGAGLLWFGWFGFNAGSALAANETASLAFINTIVATGAAGFGWIVVEKMRDGAATTLGIASGIVAGLVAITPAAATMTPVGALVLGLVAGAICAVAVSLKYKLGYDDSLDVVGVHLVGGIIGALAIGVWGSAALGADSLLSAGSASLLGKQAIAIGATLVYSFVVTFIIGKVLDMTMGFRVDEEAEVTGIDIVEHAESAYDLNTSSSSGLSGSSAAPIAADTTKVEADA